MNRIDRTDPTHPQHPWQRLTAAARRAPDGRESAAPFGFSTRMVALALEQHRAAAASLFERFSLRALGVASLLAVVSVVANFSAFAPAASTEDDVYQVTDNAATLLDLQD